MSRQKKSDIDACKKIIKRFKNVKILYIHTNYMINGKNIRLIESCRKKSLL